MTPAQMLDLYRRRNRLSEFERTRAIQQLSGSPLGVSGIASLLGCTERHVRRLIGPQRGRQFNPETLPDIIHLLYLRQIGARLDRDALHRVTSGGTSQSMLAALMGVSRQRLHQIIEED